MSGALEPVEEALATALLDELLGLSYHALEECVRDLLTRLGYRSVEVLSRRHRRQRTSHGGYDMLASSHVGVTSSRMLVQVKQYKRPVSRRFVDELAGAAQRAQARHGLLITTGTFARPARHAAKASAVRLVDRYELVSLLGRHRVGVKKGRTGRLRCDRVYFRRLRQRFPGTQRSGSLQRRIRKALKRNHPAKVRA